MKRSFMVEFELPEEFSDEFVALIPEQRMMIDRLLLEGKVRTYALAMDRSVLWMIMDAASEFDVLEIIATMPLSDYLDPYISELMFHDSSEVVHEVSLN